MQPSLLIRFSNQMLQARKNRGLSQVALAHLSGLSLPALQNLEAARGNPSLDTLQRLAEALSLKLELTEEPLDWERFIELGLPLQGNSTQKPIQRRSFAELRRYIQRTSSLQLEPRERVAFEAVCLALRDHFLKLFKKLKLSLEFEVTGQHIKLRRIALARICEYL